MGFKCLTCCDRDFWPEAFYVWHSISYYAVNSHKIYLRTIHLKKVPVKLQVPKNCILPGCFKILPPRRHSLGQRVRKGCGILSFSPSLYIYMYICIFHKTYLRQKKHPLTFLYKEFLYSAWIVFFPHLSAPPPGLKFQL